MPTKNKHNHLIGFSLLLLFFLAFSVILLKPFLSIIALAAILAILFLPVYNWLERRLKFSSLAALATIVIILTIVITPLYFISQVLVEQAVTFYSQYKSGDVQIGRQILISHIPATWQNMALTELDVFLEKLSSWARNLSTDLTQILANIAGFFLSLFILFFTIYYFLKDHQRIKHYFDNLIILPPAEEGELVRKIINSVNGIVKGNFIMAILQGGAATAGFLLSGVPQPVFWGFVTMISAFVPVIGTSLVVIPVIIYLLVFKTLVQALILIIWYAAVHVSIDQLVGPKLIGSQSNMHPLLVLFSIVGGLELFGPLGFLFGPIAMAIFVGLIDSYIAHYKNPFKK